ncbi:hypothetical protein AC1031_011960 [Aphanomyces cochlioides]|nr:hypothetical protein AC1031_011960 [Aphanomyces cochlioides]
MQEVDPKVAKQLQRRIKRRGYIRKMMQQYRQKEKLELVFLRSQAAQLETEVAQLLQSSFPKRDPVDKLPWKEVAAALLPEKRLALSQQRALTEQVEGMQALVEDMALWVSANTSIPISPTHQRLGWRNMTLLANPASRAMGKEWITQQLFHNSTSMFQYYGFPTLDAPGFETTDVRFYDDYFTFVRCNQFEIDPRVPVELQLAAFANNICDSLMVNGLRTIDFPTIKESTATTTLHQMTTVRDEAINILCGRFSDGNRSVLVAQQIMEDELWYHGKTQRDRTLIFERTTVGGRSVVRMLYLMRQSKNANNEYVCLKDEAKEWNGGNGSQMHESTFRRDGITYGQILSTRGAERTREHMMRMMMRRGPPPK